MNLIAFFPCDILAAPKPQTIPAIQEWITGTGAFTFTTNSRVIVNTTDATELVTDGNTFAEDLSELLGRFVQAVTATTANDGDIFLKLDTTDTEIGDEGYVITIGSSIEISAKKNAGAFYGTRTLLQLLKQGSTISKGTIRDWPKGKWRGTMQDLGRKFYPVSWLKTAIKDLAYVKMNLFHFHLSDALSKTNIGYFRIESESHPEISATSIQAGKYYTKSEITELVALGQKYHVTIVPEFDFPGHCSWLYNTCYKNLLLESRVLGNQYYALDLSKDSAYILVTDIINEFIPLFPGPFWHIGADEYMFIDEYSSFHQLTTWAQGKYGSNAHGIDCYRHFVNWADSLIQSKGKTTIAWNDILLGFAESGHGVCPVNTSIHIQHWSHLSWIGWGGVYPGLVKDRGHPMLNCPWSVYYILGGDGSTGKPDWVYNNFEIYKFDGGDLTEGDEQILGAVFPVWADVPDQQTVEQVWDSTFMLCRGVAQKSWGSPTFTTNYIDFATLANTLGRAPDPMTGFKTVSPKYFINSYQKIECIKVYNIRGILIQTLSGNILKTNSLNTLLNQYIKNNNSLVPGYYLINLDGKNINNSVPIMVTR